MTTVIEDKELLTELEELYLLSKHWISDLAFLETEMAFFQKMFTINTAMLAAAKDFKTITDTLISIARANKHQQDLKVEIGCYLHKLEQLVINTDQGIELDLLETYNSLEGRIHNVLGDLKSIKANILALSKQPAIQ